MSDNNAILEQYFGYLPSIPLAVVATVLYFLVSLPLFYQSYRHKNKLTYVLPITGLVESVGYIFRLYMTENASQGVYVIMALLIILAPNALAFANYKVLGKIIQSKAGELRLHSPLPGSSAETQSEKWYFHIPYLMTPYGEVHGNRVASFFFISDVAAILLQGSGGGMQGGGQVTLGTDVLLIGLASQLFFFGVFSLLAAYVFYSPIYRQSGNNSSDLQNRIKPQEYDCAFYGLFATILFLYLRNIYRVIEFATGYRGYVSTNEGFMYFFDTLFIFIAFILYIYYNFAAFLSKSDAQMQLEQAHGNDFQGDGDGAQPSETRSVNDKSNIHLVKMEGAVELA